jgi:hypothetical protein
VQNGLIPTFTAITRVQIQSGTPSKNQRHTQGFALHSWAKWTRFGAPFAPLNPSNQTIAERSYDLSLSRSATCTSFAVVVGKTRDSTAACAACYVDVNRGAQRGMSQQLLHDFEFRPYAPEQSRVGVPKCVPANPLLDPESFRNRSDNPAKDCLPPVRMAAAMLLIGKNPVIGFAIFAALSPVNERRGKNRMNRNRLLRCLGLASTYDAISYRTCLPRSQTRAQAVAQAYSSARRCLRHAWHHLFRREKRI